jgi:hypothetical protein
MNSLKNCFIVLFIILSQGSVAAACTLPTTEELADFFSHTNEWTEVQGPQSFALAERNPVFIFVDFEIPENSVAEWGQKGEDGQSIDVCLTAKPNELIVRARRGTLRVTRHSATLISSHHWLVGRYYFRPNHMIQLAH